MRKLATAILITLIGLSAWQTYSLWPVAPCSRPLSYSLGTFDNRFGVSQAAFLEALKEAEAVWEKPLGRNLFAYASSTGKLKVNLVYDYRQEATDKLLAIEDKVKAGESDYRALERRYDSLKAEYDAQSAAYDGTPEAARRINGLADQINAIVPQINALAKSLNMNARQYNAIGQKRGDEFAGGLYTLDASGERIDIYEFEDRQKLVRVLAHELGHALGLEHVEDPDAIMYYLNQGTAAKVTAADLAAAKALCGIQ